MTAALTVQGLTKPFGARRSLLGASGAGVPAVRDVSFTVAAGETLGIVGESGSGKSTTARLVTRLVDPDAGTVRIGDVDLTTLHGKRLREGRRGVQMVFQDPYSSLDPTKMIVHAIGEPLAVFDGLRGRARDQRVGELLEQVGLSRSHAHRYPYEFSGGQRQRIAIARALAPNPTVLVADEPVSALDVSTQAQVLNLLRTLTDERLLAMVFISHDLGVVRHVADRVAVMYLGSIVESGPSAELYASPKHPYTQALLSAVPQLNPAHRRNRVVLAGEPSAASPSGCPFAPRCAEATDQCRTDRPELQLVNASTSVACHLHTPVAVVPRVPSTSLG